MTDIPHNGGKNKDVPKPSESSKEVSSFDVVENLKGGKGPDKVADNTTVKNLGLPDAASLLEVGAKVKPESVSSTDYRNPTVAEKAHQQIIDASQAHLERLADAKVDDKSIKAAADFQTNVMAPRIQQISGHIAEIEKRLAKVQNA